MESIHSTALWVLNWLPSPGRNPVQQAMGTYAPLVLQGKRGRVSLRSMITVNPTFCSWYPLCILFRLFHAEYRRKSWSYRRAEKVLKWEEKPTESLAVMMTVLARPNFWDCLLLKAEALTSSVFQLGVQTKRIATAVFC